MYTQIYGKLTGELNLAQSPYRVTQNIVVDSNSTLKINAGVELYFDENTRLIVKGELLVEGTNSQIVQFKCYNSSKKWSGIKILLADKPAKFNFVKIQDIRQESDTSYISSSISIMNSELSLHILGSIKIPQFTVVQLVYTTQNLFSKIISCIIIMQMFGGAL